MKLTLTYICLFLFQLTYSQRDSLSVDYADNLALRYDNFIYKKSIHTPQLYMKGVELSYPIIELNSGQQLELHFDDFSETVKDYGFMLVHCSPDWKPTDLFTSEFVDGFQEENISSYDFSFNTIQKYIHYNTVFPHENMQITKSGNYILKVYEDYDTEKVVLTMRFLVVSQQLKVNTFLRQSSIVADRNYKHELDFQVVKQAVDIADPFSEIEVVLLQNFKWNNAVTGLQPKFVNNDFLSFDYDFENNFGAGNEFRYFDTRSLRFQSERIKKNAFIDSTNHTFLQEDKKRSYKQYRYYRDLNGLNTIEYQEGGRDYIEADYTQVHFSLNLPRPIENANIYVFGAFTQWAPKREAKLRYNYDTKVYEATMLLKQGYYNYKYAILKDGDDQLDEEFLEGNFYQTRNTYSVLVYYKSMSSDFYELLAVESINSQF